MNLDNILKNSPNKITLSSSSPNVIIYPYNTTTEVTKNGVTFTFSEDGGITVNGKASDNAVVILKNNITLKENTTYTLSGFIEGSNAYLQLKTTSGAIELLSSADTTDTFNTYSYTTYTLSISVMEGDTANAVFYPQLEKGISATDFSLNTGDKEVRKVSYGSKNLIPYPYYNITKTENEVTFTVNSDSSVTVNGTATADTMFFLCGVANYTIYKGTYTLSGCPSGGSNTTYCQVLGSSDYMDVGSGVTRTYSQDIKQNIFIKIFAGYTANNLVFKPQLEFGTRATEYVKYNREVVWQSADSVSTVSNEESIR